MSSDRVWVLGASDPEMEAIEKLLLECGEHAEHAVGIDGARVTPVTAYAAVLSQRADDIAASGGTVYMVECALPAWGGPARARCVLIDHHHPGDRGYGRPPAEFMASSSIGQVIAHLASCAVIPWHAHQHNAPFDVTVRFDGGRWEVATEDEDDVGRLTCSTRIPPELVLCAAADHCLGAAYRGECPGVDPAELMRWRVASRARFQGRPESEVLSDIERAREALAAAPLLVVGSASTLIEPGWDGAEQSEHWYDFSARDMRTCPVCDGRGGALDLDAGYDVCHCGPRGPVPELVEAACRDGISYVSGPLVGHDGRRKYTVSGAAEVVRAWMDSWAPAHGLTGIYGDPARGFAGGYATQTQAKEWS